MTDTHITGERISWNAHAFMGGVFWFAYHRLYWEAAVVTAVTMAGSFSAGLVPLLGGLSNLFALQAALSGCLGNWFLYNRLSRGKPYATDKITPAVLFIVFFLWHLLSR
jgi:hypothetical protein